MKHFSLLFISIALLLSLVSFTIPKAYSDELDEISKKIADLQSALSSSERATAPFLTQLNQLKVQLDGITNQVAVTETNIAIKKKDIDKGYQDLSSQTDTFNKTVRNYYIKSYLFSPILIFLSSDDAQNATRLIAYQKKGQDEDKSILTNIALKIVDLEQRKQALEAEQQQLTATKAKLDIQNAEVQKLVDGAKAYQATLSSQIAELSAKQQSIINQRSGGFTATIGDSDLADDYNASIKGFKEAAPSGYFSVFSFGAHTHRKGMSQYGARGRAQSGQDFKTILKAYYGKEPVSKDTGGSIKVAGFGEMDFEGKYLYGIAEMPSTWHPEALKAQAVAARTYAYRYKNEGKEICTTEACQVYNDGKANNSPQAWKDAVDATRGQVLEDVVTYYASTHGGFASPIGWDTTDGGGGSNFADKAYDKVGGSPWLYKSWYTKGYSSSSDKCGRTSPWLSPEEMADIVNAAIALRTSGVDTGRITPVTTSCWGGSPYSMEELRNLVSGNGGITSATSVTVTQGNGSTNNVTVNGVSLSGDDFKRAFNLRAPGYLSIPQSGFAFFNIEKK